MDLGDASLIGRTPQFAPGEDYVIDNTGNVWLLVHDGGMVTRADYTGKVWSAGTAWLEAAKGPLVGFDARKFPGTGNPAQKVAAISKWVDDANADRGEALTWHRVSKVAEEAGEALSALLGVSGQNPRKGVYSSQGELIEELLDVAVAALGAVEHLTQNHGHSMEFLMDKIDRVHKRAGLDTEGE